MNTPEPNEPNEPWIDPNTEGSSGGTVAYLMPESGSNQKGSASGCDATGNASDRSSTGGLLTLLLALFMVTRKRLDLSRGA